MKVSLVADAPEDDRVIYLVPGSGHAIVTTASGTFLAIVRS